MIALVFFREVGNLDTLANMRRLGAKLKTLGKDLPMFAVSSDTQDDSFIHLWNPGENVDLLHPAYALELLDPHG